MDLTRPKFTHLLLLAKKMIFKIVLDRHQFKMCPWAVSCHAGLRHHLCLLHWKCSYNPASARLWRALIRTLRLHLLVHITDPGLLWAYSWYKTKVQLGCLLVAYALRSLWRRARMPTHTLKSHKEQKTCCFVRMKWLISPGVVGSQNVVLGLVEEFSSPGGKKVPCRKQYILSWKQS